MTEFSATTAFQIVRRLATAGPETPSVYLLICPAAACDAVKSDLDAEVQVQLGVALRPVAIAGLQLNDSRRPVLVELNHWDPKLIDSIDRNIVLLTVPGATLLLATPEIAERTLSAAPNLRNRLTDVLTINPEEAFGGSCA